MAEAATLRATRPASSSSFPIRSTTATRPRSRCERRASGRPSPTSTPASRSGASVRRIRRNRRERDRDRLLREGRSRAGISVVLHACSIHPRSGRPVPREDREVRPSRRESHERGCAAGVSVIRVGKGVGSRFRGGIDSRPLCTRRFDLTASRSSRPSRSVRRRPVPSPAQCS